MTVCVTGVLVAAPISFLTSVIEYIGNTTFEHVEKEPKEAERQMQLGSDPLARDTR